MIPPNSLYAQVRRRESSPREKRKSPGLAGVQASGTHPPSTKVGKEGTGRLGRGRGKSAEKCECSPEDWEIKQYWPRKQEGWTEQTEFSGGVSGLS